MIQEWNESSAEEAELQGLWPVFAVGDSVTLRVEFSAPKLLLGNNFDELESDDFGKVLYRPHGRLKEMGVRVATDVLR